MGEGHPRIRLPAKRGIESVREALRGPQDRRHEIGAGRPQAPVGLFEDDMDALENLFDGFGTGGEGIADVAIHGELSHHGRILYLDGVDGAIGVRDCWD